MDTLEDTEPSMSDLSNITGLSQLLKNDDSIADKVRSLLEDSSPTKKAQQKGEDMSDHSTQQEPDILSSKLLPAQHNSSFEDKGEKSVNVPTNLSETADKNLTLKNVTNDDMLSLSTATEYQELPDVSPGSSLKKNTEQAVNKPQLNSAESLAKISGKVRYYLESDPNTPQLDENGEEIENLKKYIEGGAKPAGIEEETPLLLQDSEKPQSSATSENVQSDPNSDEIRISPIPTSKKAWQSSTESIDSEDNLTERIRKTLQESGRDLPESPPSKVEKRTEFFSLPSSPKPSYADQSLGSNDSLANHVKGLLSMRPRSASPMSMLHKSDRKILLSLNHEINSNTAGNLSQEIRNFEATDLWKFAEQFMPTQNTSTTDQNKKVEAKLPVDGEANLSTNNDLDKSAVSLSSSVDSILRRIHETRLPTKDESHSPMKSPTRSHSRTSRLPIYSPKHRKLSKSNSPPKYAPAKTSPSKIPKFSPTYKQSWNPVFSSVTSAVTTHRDNYKENKNPFAEVNLQPFKKIFGSERDGEYLKQPRCDMEFITPLQPKANTIDHLSTSSLLRYKCDFPTPASATPLDSNLKKHSISSNKSDDFLKRPAVPRKSLDKKSPIITSSIDFPRSSYLREKIGIKSTTPVSKCSTLDDSMQPLQGKICDATPAKHDDYFWTPKASASPMQSKTTPVQRNIKPVTILPTYDQMVVQDSLKVSLDAKKTDATPQHYSISEKSRYSPVVTHSTPMQRDSVIETYTKVPTSSIMALDRHLSNEDDLEIQRRILTPSNGDADQNITIRSIADSKYPRTMNDTKKVPDSGKGLEKSLQHDSPKSSDFEQCTQSRKTEHNFLPNSPALPYVRLKHNDVEVKPGASVSRNKESPLRSISTEKVQSILLKEQNETLQKSTNSQPANLSQSKSKNINTSDPNVVLNKDLESLLQFCADKAPVITEILRHIYEQSVQKKKEAATVYKPSETKHSQTKHAKNTEQKQSKGTQTWGDEIEIYEADLQREVACQVGSIFAPEPKIEFVTRKSKMVDRSMITNSDENRKPALPTKVVEAEKETCMKPPSYFVEFESTKAMKKREENVKVKPVAWFEPYKFEPPWLPKTEPINYGYVNTNVQDAFLEHKRDFVLRSWERQEDIQIRAEQRKVKEIEENIHEKLREMHAANNEMKTVVREPHFAKPQKPVALERQKPIKNQTFKEMFEKSRKAYLNLPEVKARREKQKRMEAYAENRLRAQIYKTKVQKNVLNTRRSQG